MSTLTVFDEWSATLRVIYDENQFTEEDVRALFVRAGLLVGIGHWRPGHYPGMHYGRFEVVE